jgi:hypothetical protein
MQPALRDGRAQPQGQSELVWLDDLEQYNSGAAVQWGSSTTVGQQYSTSIMIVSTGMAGTFLSLLLLVELPRLHEPVVTRARRLD